LTRERLKKRDRKKDRKERRKEKENFINKLVEFYKR
jgi:hypothetical protein